MPSVGLLPCARPAPHASQSEIMACLPEEATIAGRPEHDRCPGTEPPSGGWQLSHAGWLPLAAIVFCKGHSDTLNRPVFTFLKLEIEP